MIPLETMQRILEIFGEGISCFGQGDQIGRTFGIRSIENFTKQTKTLGNIFFSKHSRVLMWTKRVPGLHFWPVP
jgi:hypothetical protein